LVVGGVALLTLERLHQAITAGGWRQRQAHAVEAAIPLAARTRPSVLIEQRHTAQHRDDAQHREPSDEGHGAGASVGPGVGASVGHNNNARPAASAPTDTPYSASALPLSSLICPLATSTSACDAPGDTRSRTSSALTEKAAPT